MGHWWSCSIRRVGRVCSSAAQQPVSEAGVQSVFARAFIYHTPLAWDISNISKHLQLLQQSWCINFWLISHCWHNYSILVLLSSDCFFDSFCHLHGALTPDDMNRIIQQTWSMGCFHIIPAIHWQPFQKFSSPSNSSLIFQVAARFDRKHINKDTQSMQMKNLSPYVSQHKQIHAVLLTHCLSLSLSCFPPSLGTQGSTRVNISGYPRGIIYLASLCSASEQTHIHWCSQ